MHCIVHCTIHGNVQCVIHFTVHCVHPALLCFVQPGLKLSHAKLPVHDGKLLHTYRTFYRGQPSMSVDTRGECGEGVFTLATLNDVLKIHSGGSRAGGRKLQ